MGFRNVSLLTDTVVLSLYHLQLAGGEVDLAWGFSG